MQFKTEKVTNSPDIVINRAGNGPLLILLHGIGGNKSNWYHQMQYFHRFFDTVAWDARGYGDSDDYDGDLNFEDFSKDLLTLINHCNSEKAHLCGLSMGGQIAQDFYRLYPDRVKSLTLAATFTHWLAILNQDALNKYLDLRLHALKYKNKSLNDIAQDAAKQLIGPKTSKNVLQQITDSMGMLHKDSYIKTLISSTQYTNIVELEKITVPTLYIFAEDDSLCPVEYGITMAKKTPNSQFVLVKNSGHLINLEQPEYFNESVLNFLLSVENK
tara:strand:- start:517 stop:1332 length:816 start_codon:yes stop_codon:yes gene_type:complete